MKNFSNWVIFSFVALAIIVSIVSTLHSINFFKLTNSPNMATTLAIAFEIGQLASLAAIVNSDKINPRISWALFIFLTIFQIMNNIFHSFEYLSANPNSYKNWSELFGLNKMDDLIKKRMLSIISGGFLPLLSIGFSKALVNYLRSLENIKKENLLKKESIIPTEIDNKEIINLSPIEEVSNEVQNNEVQNNEIQLFIETNPEKESNEIILSEIESLNKKQLFIGTEVQNNEVQNNEVQNNEVQLYIGTNPEKEISLDNKSNNQEISQIESIKEQLFIETNTLIIETKDESNKEPLTENSLTENSKEIQNFTEFEIKKTFSDSDSTILQIEEPAFITRIRKATFLSPELSTKLKSVLGNNLDFNHPNFKETLKQKLINNTELKDFVVKKLKEIDSKS